MTKDKLYELDAEVYKNIDRIKREQAEYLKGVEDGIELMYKAVKAALDKEEEKTAKEAKEINDCGNCAHKNNNFDGCKMCFASYDKATNTHSTPSHWKAKESEDTE